MADKTTYTPETYQTSYVDFYNMGGIDVTKAPDPDPDPDPDPVVRPNVLDPVGGDDNSNIFTGVSLSTGKPAFKVGSVDYNEYIQNFDTNLDNQAKKGEDKSLGGFTEWVAEQLKKPEMMVGAATGVPALGGIMAAAGAMNRKKQYENASKIAATGGTGGSMFMVNNQTISRAPGSRIYSGTLGDMSQQQVAAVEAISRNFIPGTMQENQNADEDGGGYSVTGKSGLVSIDGAIMDAYGNIHSAAGPQMASASQATALREKLYVDAMNAAGYTINKKTLAADALAMKQSLNASAKGGIGFFETVGRQDTGAYNTNLSGSQQFIQNYLAERHEEKKAAPEDEGLPPTVIAAQEAAAPADGGLPPTVIAAQEEDSGGAAGSGLSQAQRTAGDRYQAMADRGYSGAVSSGNQDENEGDNSYGPSDGYSGTSGGFAGARAMGGRIGMQAGGVAAGPAGFVESPPSRVSEAATVADDKPMSVPEGTFVINAAAVEFAGEEDIADMLKKAYVKAGKKDMGGPSTQEIDVAVSRGEVIVPPHIAKIIGYDRLEKINNRGKKETKQRIEENGQRPAGAAGGGFLDAGKYAEGGDVGEDIPFDQSATLDDANRKEFKTFLSSKRQRGDVEKLIDNMDDRGRLFLLGLVETTASTDSLESMTGVMQTAINRANTDRPSFKKVNDLASVMKQRSSRGSGSRMFQYDGLEPKKITPRLQEVMQGRVPSAVTKLFTAAENLMNPETEGQRPLPFDVMFYTKPNAPLAKDFENNPMMRYFTSFGGHDYYALDAAPEGTRK